MGCYVCCPLAAGRHRRAALVARGMVGLWLRLQVHGFFAHRRMCGAVLSHSRERTKGRPVAAKPSQHHGCPRTPRRLAWGWSLLLRAANCFLAGAAWNALRCYACCPLAAGRHRWAALAARGVVGLSGDGYCVWTDKEDKARFSATVHGRRSMSSLRRPPQEVAASLDHVEGRKYGRSGATVGESRPSARNPAHPSPEGKVSRQMP